MTKKKTEDQQAPIPEAETAVEPGTALTVPEQVAVALRFEETKKEFADLAASSKDIVAITNAAAFSECHAARMRLLKARTNTTKRGKSLRDDANEYLRIELGMEKELLAIIGPEETRLEVIEDAHKAKLEAEALAKENAERERMAKIQAGIESMKTAIVEAAGQNSGVIAYAIEEVKGIDVSFAQEYADVAERTKVETVKKLTELHAAAVAQEAEAERQLVEAERLKAEREDLERRQAEQRRIEAEARARAEAEEKRRQEETAAARRKIEEEERASRERIEAQERAAREARDKTDREAREAREAEAARLKAESDRIEEAARKLREAEEEKAAAARREQEERERQARAESEALQRKSQEEERAQREAEEEAERARRLAEQQWMEMHALLLRVKERAGAQAEYAGIVKAIDRWLEKQRGRDERKVAA